MCLLTPRLSAAEYEHELPRKATDVLPTALLAGDLWQVGEEVIPDQGLFEFRVESSWGDFPVYGEAATKAAIDASGPPVTPDTRTYEADEEREQRVEAWLAKHIPGFLGPKLYTKTCLYAMPRDRNFVIDTVPEHPQIIICSGAGHAYKFASLLGKILSQMAIDGQTEYPIAPFTLQRPAITDPNYEAVFHI